MMWLVLILVGCGGKEDKSGTKDASGTIECRGMTHDNHVLWRETRSMIPTVDPLTGQGSIRCTFLTSTVLSGATVEMGSASSVGPRLDELVDAGTGYLVANGETWEIVDGTMTFDTYDDTLAIGTYTVDTESVDAAGNRTGKSASFSGPFSWCEGLRTDCPYRFDSQLTKTATIDTPVLAPTGGEPTACNMIVDTTTGALQVDMQLGTWDGRNVDQIWFAECGAFGTWPVQNNLFQFRTGDVFGPGTYGPQQSWVRNGQRLPALQFAHPAVWYPELNQEQACMLFYPYQAIVEAVDGSECSFTVDAANELFSIDCTAVEHNSSVGIWLGDVGEFHMTSDCDYHER